MFDLEHRERELRRKLADVGVEIVRHAHDDEREIETAIRQAQQTLGLMLAELQLLREFAGKGASLDPR